MANNDALLWNHVPPKLARPSAKRELLFAMTKGAYRLEGSLLCHGEFGVDAQFLLDGELHVGRTFVMKELALAWAHSERKSRQRDGWSDFVHKARDDGSDVV